MDTSLWEKVFNEREAQEINFALMYATAFNHGTSGHMEYTVIAKFAKLLEFLHVRAEDGSEYDASDLKDYLANVFGGK